MCVCVCTDPPLESDSDFGLVGDESDGGAQHIVLGALDGVGLDADHLPADLLKREDLDHTSETNVCFMSFNMSNLVDRDLQLVSDFSW